MSELQTTERRPWGHAAEPVPTTRQTTGGHRRHHLTPEDVARISKRRSDAFDLKVAGASYRQIARQLGISHGQAHEDVQAELDALAELRQAKASNFVDISMARLEKLVMYLWPKAQKGDTKAAHEIVLIQERQSKLLGADKPTKIAPTTPDGESPYQANVIDLDALSTETLERIYLEAKMMMKPKEITDGEVVSGPEAVVASQDGDRSAGDSGADDPDGFLGDLAKATGSSDRTAADGDARDPGTPKE